MSETTAKLLLHPDLTDLKPGTPLIDRLSEKVHEFLDFTDDGSLLVKSPGGDVTSIGYDAARQRFLVNVKF